MSVFPTSELVTRLRAVPTHQILGKVVRVCGQTIESQGPPAGVGSVCRLHSRGKPLLAEVVGFKQRNLLLLPYGPVEGVVPGASVELVNQGGSFEFSPQLLGCVLDGMGNLLKSSPEPLRGATRIPVDRDPPNALERPALDEVLWTGVRAIDGFLTLAKGQRTGLFAGSGVGKSTLLGMLARNSCAEVNVIALIGERGREVGEFIHQQLGEEGLKKSVVVVATSDQPPLLRLRAAQLATSVAEEFRALGRDVCLMMDSVTRVAMAAREIGLAAGEPPTTRGYPPSVFSILPRLLERAGKTEQGSITGIYTVLVEGDDLSEPVADTTRGILDGHIVLSRKLAEQNHFPAIDVLGSVSRVMNQVATPDHRKIGGDGRQLLAQIQQVDELRSLGAYRPGGSPELDAAFEKREPLKKFLQQADEHIGSQESVVALLGGIVSCSSISQPSPAAT